MSACSNVPEQRIANSKDKLQSGVAICAESLSSQSNTSLSSFVAVDVAVLDYFIILAERAVSANFDEKIFCHIDKSSLKLVFKNGSQPSSFKTNRDSRDSELRYREVYSGNLEIKQAKFVKYKLINGIWRYIEERTIPSS